MYVYPNITRRKYITRFSGLDLGIFKQPVYIPDNIDTVIIKTYTIYIDYMKAVRRGILI